MSDFNARKWRAGRNAKRKNRATVDGGMIGTRKGCFTDPLRRHRRRCKQAWDSIKEYDLPKWWPGHLAPDYDTFPAKLVEQFAVAYDEAPG